MAALRVPVSFSSLRMFLGLRNSVSIVLVYDNDGVNVNVNYLGGVGLFLKS